MLRKGIVCMQNTTVQFVNDPTPQLTFNPETAEYSFILYLHLA